MIFTFASSYLNAAVPTPKGFKTAAIIFIFVIGTIDFMESRPSCGISVVLVA
jgi:hypothetical protein